MSISWSVWLITTQGSLFFSTLWGTKYNVLQGSALVLWVGLWAYSWWEMRSDIGIGSTEHRSVLAFPRESFEALLSKPQVSPVPHDQSPQHPSLPGKIQTLSALPQLHQSLGSPAPRLSSAVWEGFFRCYIQPCLPLGRLSVREESMPQSQEWLPIICTTPQREMFLRNTRLKWRSGST